MAGESSKNSGEFGEKIVSNFLKLIGWENPQSGVDIKCFKPKYHQSSKKERKTHGIDFIYQYQSSLTDFTQENCVISVKNCKNYPNRPMTTFKSFLKELAFAQQCFKINPDYSNIYVSPEIESKNSNGILFWLSYEDDFKESIINKIYKMRNSDNIDFDTIYVVDNKCISFITSAILDAKSKVSTGELYFLCQTTGNNNSSLNRKNEDLRLQVEFINSPIIPLKVTKKKEEKLFLYTSDPFKPFELLRLIGLANKLTENWANKIIILFPDYRSYKHKNDANSIKSQFQNQKFVSKIKIQRYSYNSFKVLEDIE